MTLTVTPATGKKDVPVSTEIGVKVGGGEVKTVALRIHTHAREGALQLFGFATAVERVAFEILLRASRVGPKLAQTVLSGIDPLRVCTSYRHPDGAVFDDFPYHQSILHASEAVYEELPGFGGEIGHCRSADELPVAARRYLQFVSGFVGVPVRLVGVGPGRNQVIWIDRSDEARPREPGRAEGRPAERLEQIPAGPESSAGRH